MESSATPGLAWKWILEKLVDLPDFGVKFFNEVITKHVTDIEEPHCRPLMEQVALRNLEEMVVANQIDADAIPLLKALTGQGLGPGTAIGSSVKERSNKELVLRIQTEVVISVLRKDVDEGEIDWAFYEAELERVFGNAEEDNRLLDRKRELSALLKPKNQTKAIVASYFEKYALNKLRNDLSSFIEEKRKSFKTTFLNQLSRDFRDANGKPFAEEVEKFTNVEADGNPLTEDVEKSTSVEADGKPLDEDVEKSTNVEANGKQDHVGQTPNVNETEDQHIVLGTAIISDRKRSRRKLLPTHDGIHDDESDEAGEGSAGMKKPRHVSLTSIVEPLLHQGDLELAVSEPGRRTGCFSMKQDVESRKQLSLSNRGEEPSSGLGNLVLRSCSPEAHESISMEVAKVSLREPSRSNKYVVISDVDSDAETQVVKTLSTDDEDSVTVEGDGDKHNKNGAQSLPENGSGRGHPQAIVEAEVVREETSIVLIEQKILVDRKEASKGSPEVKVSQHEGHEKSITKDFTHLDSQDTYEIDFLEVGNDGHEDACHICGKHGILFLCEGCPISMHSKCIKGLGVRLPKPEQDWYCPVCFSRKAAREAAEAEKAANVAKEKLKAFKMKSKKRDRFAEGENSSPEKAGDQSRLRISSLESGESDRALKPKEQSDDEPKQGQRNSDPPIESLGPTVLKKAFHQLRQKSSDRSLPADKPEVNRLVTLGKGVVGNNVEKALPVNEQLVLTSPNALVKSGAGSIRDVSAKPHKTQLSHEHEVSRRDRFAASTSGQAKRERERYARLKMKIGTEVDSDEETGEQARTGVPEPANGAGSRREMESDEDDEELDEDCSEDGIQGTLFSGRQRKPGFRRTPLPWTKQEELALKEGVKRFSHNGSWGFQWKRILQFGQGRFDPTRTDVDLKDKWRNLVKGVS